MKTYSETMKSVLEKAAVITEEKQAKAHKTRSSLKTVLGAALAFALIIGAVLVIKPFGERGNGGQLGYGAKNTSDAAKVTPDCMEDNAHKKNTPEPAPSVFITDTTAVKSYEQGDSVNAELALSMLRSQGYIEADTGTLRVNYYNTSGSVLRNCTPDYILEHGGDVEYTHTWKVGSHPTYISEHGGDIDLFQDESGAYFIRLLDQLYRYDSFGGRHINMCRWDYDSNGAADLVFYSNSGSGLDYHSVSIFDLSTRTIKEIIVKMTLAEPSFRFDFDGESIYIDGNKVEYIDGKFYICGMKADEYRTGPCNSELPKNTPDGPNFIPAEEIKVKSYNDGDSINVELACSMLEEGGYISVIDGSVYTDYTADASRLRNCTPDFIREKRADIELFQTDDNAYFLRIADKLYRFDTPGGFHMKMCLWDYDKNGIDDLVFYHSWGSGNYVVEASVLDVCMGTRMSILSRSAEVGHGFNLDYDAGRKMIYLYRNVVEYFDGEFYIGGMKVKDFCETQLLPQDTPEPTPSGSAHPDFITETTIVNNSYYYDFLNVDLVLSMIESNGYIDERTGERRFDYDRDSVYRNCTPECIRRKTADIDLVSDGGGDYFIRIKDELYSFRGSFIYMCLWDHDNNGIDDLVFCRSVTSGVYSFFANVFDLNTKEQKSIPLKEWYRESMQDAFGYDGESIYIDGFKVEYVDGAFYIGGVKADEYELAPEQNAQAHYLPAPTPFIGYAYNDILCEAPEDFSFTIKWGINGESSYSSETGRLVKTTNATHPEDYVTELFLDEYTINRFYTNMLYHIDFFALFSQRDRYDPINDPSSESWIMTEPYETVMLFIEANGNGASVICDMIPLGEYYGYCYEAYTFYNLGVRFITDIIMNSPEWQALPEYEFFHE